jgi:hypothetical protein
LSFAVEDLVGRMKEVSAVVFSRDLVGLSAYWRGGARLSFYRDQW